MPLPEYCYSELSGNRGIWQLCGNPHPHFDTHSLSSSDDLSDHNTTITKYACTEITTIMIVHLPKYTAYLILLCV